MSSIRIAAAAPKRLSWQFPWIFAVAYVALAYLAIA